MVKYTFVMLTIENQIVISVAFKKTWWNIII